jgi:anti-sigma-K factor RskA
MDHEKYEDLIALESLEALDDAGRSALEEHLRTCAACRAVRDETREAAALIGLAAEPVTPPAHVRSRVMREIRPAAAPRQWWLAAAAVLLVVAGISLWNAWKDTERKSARIAELTQQNLEARQREAELQRQVDALTSAKSISLTGQEIAPSATARVLMNERERTALVFFQNLPSSPDDKSYQLWVIRADRPAPQSVGVFQVGADGRATLGLANLPVETEIKAFALTLEPRGGVASPTGAKYLVGGV